MHSRLSMSDFSPGAALSPPFFSPVPAAPALSSVYPAVSFVSVPAVSPTRRRATSVPAQREADVSFSNSPSASPSASPPTAGSPTSGAASLAAPAPLAEVGVSQPPTPVATLSYQLDHVPALVNANFPHRTPPPPPHPHRAHESPTRPTAPPSLFPRTLPPSQPSAGAVRLLLPSAAAIPFVSLFPSSSSQSSPAASTYHQQRLFGRQRHTVVQGELLQLYLLVPHSQHVLFPWLFASATPPPPPTASSPLPSQPVLASEVTHCRFHVDVRLRAASVRTEDSRDETDASPTPPPVPTATSATSVPSSSSAPQPPTSLSLSSASLLTTPAEPSSSASGWSRFATRFGRKSGQSTEKDNSNPSAAITTATATATATATTASSASPPALASASAQPTTSPPAPLPPPVPVQSSPSPLLSPQSAPPTMDGLAISRPEPRRTRSLGMMSPTHIPPHIIVTPHSAFQHEPPFHLLPHRPSSLTCSPALHHTNSATSSGCYQFTLSNGDVVIVLETIMHASSDGHVWLEVEVHAPTSHQSLLSSLSLPAVSAPASSSSSMSPLPSMAASLRSFMSDHRVLRLPPPHPLAGCLLLISHAVNMHASVQQMNDRVLSDVRVTAQDDVKVESVELLVESARWFNLPVPLSSLFSLSMLPVSLPLQLHASEEYHFLFVLEPVVCMSQSMAQLRAQVLKAIDVSEMGGEAVDGRLLTTCVVRWRSEHASTAITSQYDVSWQLPLHVQPNTADPAALLPPTITMSHPPRVQLHSVFAITVTLHNTSDTALTCTLQLPSDDIHLAPHAATSHQPAASAHTHHIVASGLSTPANLLSPMNGLSDRPANARPFSPVDGFHFPFHSLASRLRSSNRNKPQLNGLIDAQQTVSATTELSERQQVESDEEEQVVQQQGLVCLDGEVEFGALAGGGRRSVGLQCVAVRCGFARLPRLLVHVKELDACFLCRNDGILLID